MFFYTFSVQTIDLMCQLRLSSHSTLILTNVAAYGPPLGHKSLRCLRGLLGKMVAAPQISLGPPITITTRYLARTETVAAKAYEASTCSRAGNFPLFLELISTT